MVGRARADRVKRVEDRLRISLLGTAVAADLTMTDAIGDFADLHGHRLSVGELPDHYVRLGGHGRLVILG